MLSATGVVGSIAKAPPVALPAIVTMIVSVAVCALAKVAVEVVVVADSTKFHRRSLSVIAKLDAVHKIITDPAVVQRLLVEQVTGRVRWRESAIAMKAAGVEQFVELGGKVLGPMISRTLVDRGADMEATSVVTMADTEALAKEL